MTFQSAPSLCRQCQTTTFIYNRESTKVGKEIINHDKTRAEQALDTVEKCGRTGHFVILYDPNVYSNHQATRLVWLKGRLKKRFHFMTPLTL